MPARSKSQQRLFGMLHAYNKGELHGSKALKKRLEEMSEHISDEDARHFAETSHKDLPEKKTEEYTIGEGSFSDVKSVLGSLSPEDLRLISGEGRQYHDIPSRLAGRSIARYRGHPVGFCDAWGVDDKGRVTPSPNITIAVSNDHRGKGLAQRLSMSTIEKVISRARELHDSGSEDSRLKRFVWRLHEGNDRSASAAEKAGFKEQRFKRKHHYRQFILPASDVKYQ